MVAVGIDLGTTNSCVAIYTNNSVEVIQNDTGERVTPSYVLLMNNDAIVGKGAKNTLSKNSQHLVYDAKRMIGKTYSEPNLQSDIQKLNWTFKVQPDNKQQPRIHIEKFQNQSQQFLPEQISAFVLKKMKAVAEDYLGPGKVLSKAVITVPAYFNNDQKQATMQAAAIAGLEVLYLLSEPSAAGLAFCYQRLKQNLSKEYKIFVYDLGGGTFDVSIMKIINGHIDVIITDGDTHLGGSDFDARLMKYCIDKINAEGGDDITKQSKSLRKLRTACIEAKEHLSGEKNFDYTIEFEDYEFNITRQDFERICKNLFDETMRIVKKSLSEAKLLPTDIDEVLLVGGSSRIPKVQEMLSLLFGPGKISKKVNPDEAVAIGAAIQAAILTGEIEKECNIVLMEITPLSLGIGVTGCKCATSCKCPTHTSFILPRKTKIPTKQTSSYTTSADNQTRMSIRVLEGEHLLEDKNHKIGEFTVTGIPKNSKGKESVEVTFTIDKNIILHVTAKIVSTGQNAQMEINYNKERLNQDDVERMLKNCKIA